MKRKVIIEPRARKDLKEVFQWTFDTFGPAQAERYAGILISCVEDLADRSKKGRTANTMSGVSAHERLRYERAGRHYVFFASNDTTVWVLSILHQKTNISERLRSLSLPNTEDR